MTGYINDTVWLKNKDGGEVKLSFAGYPEEEIEKTKAEFEASDWTIIDHKRTVRRFPPLPTWALPYTIGVFVGVLSSYFTAPFWSWLLSGGQ